MEDKIIISPENRAKLDEIYQRSKKRHDEMSEEQKAHLKRLQTVCENRNNDKYP